jgi:hypothetical protein
MTNIDMKDDDIEKFPIVRFQHNIAQRFNTIYPQFQQQILEGQFNNPPQRRIVLRLEECPIIYNGDTLAANIDEEGQIMIFSSFLSYLWAASYMITTFFKHFSETEENVNSSEIESRACRLFDYGHSLITTWSEWNFDLVRPDSFLPYEEIYVGQTNYAFITGATFILLHEFSHSVLGHTKHNIRNPEIEFNADDYAIELIFENLGSTEELFNKKLGTLIGISSFIPMHKILNSSKTHPNPELRVQNFIEKLNLDPKDSLWIVPCIAYSLWDQKNGKIFDYKNGEGTYKELYYSMLQSD